MLVPSWVQATCTAVNELATLSAAKRTNITPLATLKLPIVCKSVPKFMLKTFPLPDGGGLFVVVPGAGSLLFEPQPTKLHPVQTAAILIPNFAKNSCLSIINVLCFVYKCGFLYTTRLILPKGCPAGNS